jgi:hypothetical protein
MEFELIKKDLQVSGSLAVRDRDTIFLKATAKEDESGFVYAPSKKRVYNTDELKKAIDVSVFELIPNSPENNLDLVPRPIYNEATRSLEIANQTIISQSLQISSLQSDVANLTAISAALDVELDSERLLRVTAESSADTLRTQFGLITDTMQTNTQRMTLEGIENSSLRARNEGQNAQIVTLQKQIDSLSEQLNGKNARLSEGAKAGADITARILEKEKADGTDIWFDTIVDEHGDGKWLNGPTIELFNFTVDTQNVRVSQNVEDGVNWLSLPSTITLQPQEKYTFQLTQNKSVIDAAGPTPRFLGIFGGGSARQYKGTLTFTSTNGPITFNTTLDKHRTR